MQSVVQWATRAASAAEAIAGALSAKYEERASGLAEDIVAHQERALAEQRRRFFEALGELVVVVKSLD